jgi:GNAT superfamily N-acetyltransferase
VTVAVAATATVVDLTAGAGGATIGDLDDAWIEEYAAVHGEDPVARARVHAYGAMLRDLPLATAGALRREPGGAPAGLGFAVADDGWAGIFGMGTRPASRRAGAATAVLHALARWAAGRHAHRLYLQVEDDNRGARALYARAGFSDAYGYWYRTRGAGVTGR